MEFSAKLRTILQSRKGWRWVVADFLIAFFSIYLGVTLSPYADVQEPYRQMLVSTTYALILVVTIRLCGLNTHRVEHLFTRYEVVLASIQGSVIAFLIVDLVTRFVYLYHFDRYVIVTTLIFSVSGIILTRITYQWYLRNNPINVAFMCRNKLTLELTERFKSDPHFNVVCVGSEEPLKQSDHEVGFKNIVISDPDLFCSSFKK